MKNTRPGHAKNFLGGRLRELRRSIKPRVSQQDLAGRLAVMGLELDQSALSRIENQERYLMDYELFGILKALRVHPREFFERLNLD